MGEKTLTLNLREEPSTTDKHVHMHIPHTHMQKQTDAIKTAEGLKIYYKNGSRYGK